MRLVLTDPPSRHVGHCQAGSSVPFVSLTARLPRVNRSPPLLCCSPPNHLALCPLPPSSCFIMSSVAQSPCIVFSASLLLSCCVVFVALASLLSCYPPSLPRHCPSPPWNAILQCCPPPSRRCRDLIVVSVSFFFCPLPHHRLVVVYCCHRWTNLPPSNALTQGHRWMLPPNATVECGLHCHHTTVDKFDKEWQVMGD